MDEDRGTVSAPQLPAFELDCRDWLVATPADGSVPEEIAGAPLVAILSTLLVGSMAAGLFASGSAVFSVGLVDEPVATVRSGRCSPVAELIEFDAVAGSARYVVPAPHSEIALLVEFACGGAAEPELLRRFHSLMASFRWAG
ncbi:MAG: hypothetical protein JWO63_617 [Frankiales bacterium]|nr:hypothetical protein [Frankiales bacterium]